ncbi:adhesin [Neisseria meningitidis]|jgi:hypothetical protein|nr:adhesin [Neisseria meningitidis]ELK59428.1 hypothetical protein NM87255_0633 [Neisseria meningitidis 87255]ELK61229.1 hypothetical protein NM98080_0595 [Neisseria meningitidis 98080]EOB95433.1 hypothetical protein NM133_0433 [Neisseria meningitidis NM133]EOC01712.1 hypothetical protein NM94_0404 [Neisseria meningitidis NM94]EOC04127.1 hypothetical protein NM95_0399 [Neisseria meningitidis NM95]EOC13614.1 hypothetical protein NM73704_0367 [Neisseria meningitidis 73704]EOC28088.1 hypothetic
MNLEELTLTVVPKVPIITIELKARGKNIENKMEIKNDC